MPPNFIYLSSGSPRRRELLSQIGVAHEVLRAAVDEARAAAESPEAYVERLARMKAEAGWRIRPAGAAAPVLAADTAVVMDGATLGKPRDRADGERMLLQLSGRTHVVLTAVALATATDRHVRLARSAVTFRTVAPSEAAAYWDTGEPCDKAGGYAIQGRAAVFVADLHGSYSGVMGLPLFETAQLLSLAGITGWFGAAR